MNRYDVAEQREGHIVSANFGREPPKQGAHAERAWVIGAGTRQRVTTQLSTGCARCETGAISGSHIHIEVFH